MGIARNRRPRYRAGKTYGFTLVELLSVVVIIAILAAIAVPRFGDALGRQRADAAARRIAVDLKFARRKAETTSSSQTVLFDVGTDSYRLVGMQHVDRAGAEYDLLLSDEPYLATIVSANFGGDLQIVFDGWGMPDSGGSVVIQVGVHVRTISVEPDTGEAAFE